MPGWAADGQRAHRLPLFLDITGACAGDALRPELLANAIAHPGGLLGKSKGRVALFFNQVENPLGEAFARKTVALLPRSCRERLDMIIAGSAHNDRGVVLPR
jgi:probable selenium-dependent hydroxylase accessory protein YqeC